MNFLDDPNNSPTLLDRLTAPGLSSRLAAAAQFGRGNSREGAAILQADARAKREAELAQLQRQQLEAKRQQQEQYNQHLAQLSPEQQRNLALGVSPDKALGLNAQEMPAAVQQYEFARQQGYEGSFLDFQTHLKRAGAPNTTVNTSVDGRNIDLGKLEPGEALIYDENNNPSQITAVPGSQLDLDRQSDLQSSLATAQQSMEVIDSIVQDPALDGIVGMVQGRLPPMTQAGTDLNQKLLQLQGQSFLQAFESLKGGGQITEIEGQKAEQAIARLNRVQSPEAIRRSLADLREVLERGVQRAQTRAGVPFRDPQAFGQPQAAPNAVPQKYQGTIDDATWQAMTPSERAIFQ